MSGRTGPPFIAIWADQPRLAATNGSTTVNLNLGWTAPVTAYDSQTGATTALGSSTTSVRVNSAAAMIVRS
jgi:hypothetical protein